MRKLIATVFNTEVDRGSTLSFWKEGAIAELKIPSPRGEVPTYLATPSGSGPVAGRRRPTRLHRDERRPPRSRPVGWPVRATWPRRRTCSTAGPALRSCLRTMLIRDIGARRGPTFDDVDAVRAALAGRAGLHRPHRRDRLLHGRRVRARAGTGPRVRRGQHELRRLPGRRRDRAARQPVPGGRRLRRERDRSPIGRRRPPRAWTRR